MKKDVVSLKTEIENMKNKLEQMQKDGYSLTSAEIYAESVELDWLICEYHKAIED